MAVTVTSVSSLFLKGPQSSLELVTTGGTQGDISVSGMFCALMQALRSSEVSGGLTRGLMRRCYNVLMGSGKSQSCVFTLFRKLQIPVSDNDIKRAPRR